MNSMKSVLVAALAMVMVGLSLACPQPPQEAPAEKSLYERLGGKDAIIAVVDDFVARVAADTRINGFFANTDIARLKGCLVDQVCQAAGGPCQYTCRDMKSSHAGMGVSTADFNALVEDLVATLDKFKVPQREKDELLGALGPMQGDIVEKP
ncbi:MAG: group I truncated hemoglobin [Deltaproteobacteria bacterium]